MTRSLAITAVSLTLILGAPVLGQVQLDHNTAQKLSDLGINQILASDADDATKKAEIVKLLEED